MLIQALIQKKPEKYAGTMELFRILMKIKEIAKAQNEDENVILINRITITDFALNEPLRGSINSNGY